MSQISPSFPHVPPPPTQGRLVKEAGDMNLYSGIFSVMTEHKENEEVKKEKRTSKGQNGEQTKGEILTLLPHFLSFSSCTHAGSFQIEISTEIKTKPAYFVMNPYISKGTAF